MPFRLKQYLSRFRSDRRGNVAAIFAITAIPLISAIGCAVDYSLATRMKAKLQSAADAAGIAALSQKSPGFLAASVMTGNGSVTAGVTDANNVFDANMNGITGYQNLVRSSTVTKTGIKLAATVHVHCRCTGNLPESDRVSETDGNRLYQVRPPRCRRISIFI